MVSGLAPGQGIGRIFEETDATASLSLEPITEVLDGSYALLFRTGMEGDQVEEASCHGVDTGYVDRLREAGREKFLPSWLSGLAPGSVFDRATFGSDRQFARTTFYNHVIRPEGRFHCMIATPCVTSRHRFHLVVGRPGHRHEFGAEDRRVLHLLLSQVSGILRLRADLAGATATARHLQDAMDCWPAPFLTVAGDGTPRFANEAARRWLARGDLVRLDGRGRLAVGSLGETDRLHRALAAVARTGGEKVFVLETAAGGVPMEFTLKRTGGFLPDEPAEAEVGVLIRVDGSEVLEVSADRVTAAARQHHLTRRETALLERLAAGDTLRQAALHLGVSYNTCRSYLRQIFEKFDVHRQSDLVRFCVTGHHPGHHPPSA